MRRCNKWLKASCDILFYTADAWGPCDVTDDVTGSRTTQAERQAGVSRVGR